jgi:hypothetical protein
MEKSFLQDGSSGDVGPGLLCLILYVRIMRGNVRSRTNTVTVI